MNRRGQKRVAESEMGRVSLRSSSRRYRVRWRKGLVHFWGLLLMRVNLSTVASCGKDENAAMVPNEFLSDRDEILSSTTRTTEGEEDGTAWNRLKEQKEKSVCCLRALVRSWERLVTQMRRGISLYKSTRWERKTERRTERKRTEENGTTAGAKAVKGKGGTARIRKCVNKTDDKGDGMCCKKLVLPQGMSSSC